MRLRHDGQIDGRSKRATHQRWLREHVPLVYLGLYGEPGDRVGLEAERRRRREIEQLARVRREALACCVECRNPLVAAEQGFQFCPYERAGQHEKLRRALGLPAPATPALNLDAARWRRRRA